MPGKGVGRGARGRREKNTGWRTAWRNGVGRTLLDGMGVIAMRRGCSLASYRHFATVLLI